MNEIVLALLAVLFVPALFMGVVVLLYVLMEKPFNRVFDRIADAHRARRRRG